jgi:Terpene synthase family 2, C-terminal metal binding
MEHVRQYGRRRDDLLEGPHARQPIHSDLELLCPFPSGLNPYASEVEQETLAWAARLRLAAPGDELQRLGKAKIAWLPARVFHRASREVLQLAADWTTLFCVLDEQTELETQSLFGLSELLNGSLHAFRRAAARAADPPIVHALVDLQRRMQTMARASWVARFAASIEELFAGYLWETINRQRRIRPSVEAYCAMREMTIGLQPQFLFGDLGESSDRLSELRQAPTLRRLEAAASNCVGWANDLFTYEKEHEVGEFHNLVLMLARSEAIPLPAAARRVAALHDQEVRVFLALSAQRESFGEDEPQVRLHVEMLASWMRGHLDWAKETGRYRPRGAPTEPPDPRRVS